MPIERFGTSPMPLLLLQHFRGNLDNWDPALIDAPLSKASCDHVQQYGSWIIIWFNALDDV